MVTYLGATRHHLPYGLESHSVTCHPAQVNVFCLNRQAAGIIYLLIAQREGRLHWRWWLVVYRDTLHVHRQAGGVA